MRDGNRDGRSAGVGGVELPIARDDSTSFRTEGVQLRPKEIELTKKPDVAGERVTTSGRAARSPDPSENLRAKRPKSAPNTPTSSRDWSRVAQRTTAQTLTRKPEMTPPPAKAASPLSSERAFRCCNNVGAKSAGNGKISDFGQDGSVELGRGGNFATGRARLSRWRDEDGIYNVSACSPEIAPHLGEGLHASLARTRLFLSSIS